MASADCRSVVAVLEAFFAHPPAGTAAVYPFGSAARADARPDGVLVREPSRSARIRFEVRFRDEYFDMEPIRGMYRGPRPQGTAAEAPSHG